MEDDQTGRHLKLTLIQRCQSKMAAKSNPKWPPNQKWPPDQTWMQIENETTQMEGDKKGGQIQDGQIQNYIFSVTIGGILTKFKTHDKPRWTNPRWSNPRWPKWKTTQLKDNPNGKQPKRKTTQMEDNTNGK